MEYLQSTAGILVVDILICFKGLGTNRKQVLGFNATHVCSGKDEKWNLQCAKLKENKGIYKNVSFF